MIVEILIKRNDGVVLASLKGDALTENLWAVPKSTPLTEAGMKVAGFKYEPITFEE